MKKQLLEVPLATGLWTVSIAFGLTGMLHDMQRLMYLSIMSALVACLITANVMLDNATRRERIELERLVDGLIAGARERADSEVRKLR